MKSNEKLLAAIGEIDDSLIAEAEQYEGRGRVSLYKKLSVAACLLIVSAGIVGAVHLFPKPNFDAETSEPPTDSGLKNDGVINGIESTGGIIEMSFGALRQLSREGNVYTFVMTLYEQTERQDITLRGSGCDQWGEPILVISTTAPFAELTHIPVAPPMLKVDGVNADTLPTAVGEYTVEVDLSPLIDAGYEPDGYFVFGSFGRISR